MSGIDIQFAKDDEIRKLARVLSEETDAATIELGFAEPGEITPYDQLSDEAKVVYQKLAQRVYNRLAYHAGAGYIVVIRN
jgi:hypothetical protein